MDGVKLGRQLLQLRADLPIIIATGYGGAMMNEKVLELGFRDLLNKPYNVRTLGETLRRVLQTSATNKT